MELAIVGYMSVDIDEVWDWTPTSLDEVVYELTIEIAQVGQTETQMFSLTVATPEGLRRLVDQYGDRLPDRNILIFGEYSWHAVTERLKKILKRCTRRTWNASLLTLGCYLHWEYENFDAVE